jgi:DNA-binding FadR family transcriptional regulator
VGAGTSSSPGTDSGSSAPLRTPLDDGYRPTVLLGGRSEKKAEILARQILDDVIEGGQEPGTMLDPEAAMIERYRVGRTTLREALRILEVHGLLVIRSGPRGGPIVTAASSRDFGRMSSLYYRAAGVRVRDLLEARLVMEPIAARLAAEHHTEEGGARLRQVLADLESWPSTPTDKTPVREDNRPFLQASRTFHDLVNAISGNPIIDLFSQALVDMFTERMVGVVYPPDQRHHANHQHIAIAKAILRGHGPLAERLMREHMIEYRSYSWESWSGGLNEVIAWR